MELLLVLSILSAAIPVTVGVVRKQYTLLLFYPAAALSFDLLNSLVRRVWHLNNGITANAYIYAEFLFVFLLFRRNTILHRNWLFYLTVALLSIFYFTDTISNDPFRFNMFGASVFMLAYIFLSINCLFLHLKSRRVVFLEKSSDFWFSTAILLYAAGAFLIFLFKQYMVHTDVHSYMNIWTYFYYPINITKNVLLAFSIYHLNSVKYSER